MLVIYTRRLQRRELRYKTIFSPNNLIPGRDDPPKYLCRVRAHECCVTTNIIILPTLLFDHTIFRMLMNKATSVFSRLFQSVINLRKSVNNVRSNPRSRPSVRAPALMTLSYWRLLKYQPQFDMDVCRDIVGLACSMRHILKIGHWIFTLRQRNCQRFENSVVILHFDFWLLRRY